MQHPTTAADILDSMGRAGERLDHMGACEAGAGNISVSIRQTPPDLEDFFPETSEIDLPVSVPGLVGWTFFVTGSGSRLREVREDPRANVSVIQVKEGGTRAVWRTSPDKQFARPTSEFNSHLGVHEDQAVNSGKDFQAVIHAQPPYLVSLSHIPAIRNQVDFNRAIFRWEPETIVQVPDGVKVLDFMIPGGEELGNANVEGLRDHVIVLWSKHGIMVRSDASPLAAVDKVEYVETGAMYEFRNRLLIGATSAAGLPADQAGEGLHLSESQRVVDAFGVDTELYS
ncbi:class II aldolase/adducin family protein [Ancrocorticia populi]|uniref:class II aldolase/adducin family protein n=1 Tax=Ancrocorticia populi TaxID=2175228 RepID=UPI003F908B1C